MTKLQWSLHQAHHERRMALRSVTHHLLRPTQMPRRTLPLSSQFLVGYLLVCCVTFPEARQQACLIPSSITL